MGHVTVLGSLNQDCLIRVKEFPKIGQTIAAEALSYRLGGKGGNQALAARRQGATVSMLGSVGEDTGGAEYLRFLANEGVETEGVVTRPGTRTGMATILVNARADNMIVAHPGANAAHLPEDVEAQRVHVARATVLLAQLELPLETVLAGLELAPLMGCATCFNPSPWREDFPWGRVGLDFVIVNEGEARQLLGRNVLHLGESTWLMPKLEDYRIRTLIVTRGADSTLVFCRKDGLMEIPTAQVEPVDTVGAGDCFAGVFAARYSEARALQPSLRAASLAATLSTLREGAQEAIPDRELVEEALSQVGHAR